MKNWRFSTNSLIIFVHQYMVDYKKQTLIMNTNIYRNEDISL